MVFTIRVRQPRSFAARCWNIVQDLVSAGAFTLIVLRLTGVINWSWWWVLSPVWISGVVMALFITGMVILLRREARKHLCAVLPDLAVAVVQRLRDGGDEDQDRHWQVQRGARLFGPGGTQGRRAARQHRDERGDFVVWGTAYPRPAGRALSLVRSVGHARVGF